MDDGVRLVSLHKKGRGNWVLVLFSHDKIGGSYERVNRTGNGKSCRGKGGFLLLLLFTETKSEGHGLQLACPWTGKPRRYRGT